MVSSGFYPLHFITSVDRIEHSFTTTTTLIVFSVNITPSSYLLDQERKEGTVLTLLLPVLIFMPSIPRYLCLKSDVEELSQYVQVAVSRSLALLSNDSARAVWKFTSLTLKP
jgi:hypothetical protein